MSTAIEATPSIVTSVIAARTDIERYRASLVEETQEALQEVEQRLAKARVVHAAAEAADAPHTRGMEMAEHIGLEDQVRLHDWARGSAVRSARRRVTVLAREADQLKRFGLAVQAGHLPMPRLPALKLDYARNAIPVEALESLEAAQQAGIFDEFRLIDGRDANAYGYPTSHRAPPKGRDPILVGMIGREMFPLAWWR